MSGPQSLTEKRCRPCEGGVPPLGPDESDRLVEEVEGWRKLADGITIRREWKAKDFAEAMRFLARVAELAEAEGHHPDLHLTGYRMVAIELTTHAVGGLTENDFIVAAKVDRLGGPGAKSGLDPGQAAPGRSS